MAPVQILDNERIVITFVDGSVYIMNLISSEKIPLNIRSLIEQTDIKILPNGNIIAIPYIDQLIYTSTQHVDHLVQMWDSKGQELITITDKNISNIIRILLSNERIIVVSKPHNTEIFEVWNLISGTKEITFPKKADIKAYNLLIDGNIICGFKNGNYRHTYRAI